MPSRSIATDMWSDPRVVGLGCMGKLVFVRLITGPETTAAGVTRVAPEVLAAYLGMTPKAARGALDELLGVDLLREYDGWWWMPKFIDHQLSGPGFIVAIRRSMKGLPESLQTAIDRALISKVGEKRARQKPDSKPTGKRPNSRSSVVRPTITPGSDGGSEGEKYQDQYQNQPKGLVGSGGGAIEPNEETLGSLAGPAPLADQGVKSNGRHDDEPGHSLDDGRVDFDRIAAAASPMVRQAIERARAAR